MMIHIRLCFAPKLPPFCQLAWAIALSLGLSSVTSAAGLVYVDADDGFETSTPNLSPLSAIDLEQSIAADNLWGYRGFGSITPGATIANIYEASTTENPGTEDVPELTILIDNGDGLVDNTSYDIYVAYWTAGGQDWSIQAGLSSGSYSLYNNNGPNAFLPNAMAGTSAESTIWMTPPTITTEADRVMLLGYAGTTTKTAGNPINVFVNDLPTTAYPDDIDPGGAFGFRTWFDGVAFIESGIDISLSATVDRDTGEITLSNNTGQDAQVISVSINSATGALDPNAWLSISDNYDEGGGFDTDVWNITAPAMPFPTATTTLSEAEDASGGGSGGTLTAAGLNLGNAWIRTPQEDLQVSVTLTDSSVVTITPQYTGSAILPGNFDGDTDVDLTDYNTLVTNLHTDVSSLQPAEAYFLGDMNGDLALNYADFVAFRTAYDDANGSGAFSEVFGVPEPSSITLLGITSGLLILASFWRRRLERLELTFPRGCCSRSFCHAIHRVFESLSPETSTMTGKHFPIFLAVLAACGLVFSTQALAIEVTLTATDAFDGTSFNVAGGWSNTAAPSAGNDYFTGNFGLRTPADGNSYTFAGDSLTVNNTNFDPNAPAQPNGGLWWKGTGAAATITINNLILDGGYIVALNGPGDIFNLAGNLNVVSDSFIHARQGPINISAVVDGSGTITNPQSDGPGSTIVFQSPNNTYNGSIVNNGRFTLADNSVMNFSIGANGVNNSISGAGAENIFDGDFVFDLSSASSNLGDSWAVVTATNVAYGDTFNIDDFFEFSTGTWVSGAYQFSEATGMLSVAEELELLTLQVNTGNGQVRIVNGQDSASFDVNYYEIRSASGSLDVDAWTSIDGNVPASETTWEKAGGSTENLISEINLQGMMSLDPMDPPVSIGNAYGGTLPEHQDIEFFYGTIDSAGSLFRGSVEYITSQSLLGDYNEDGIVNAADYVVWRNNEGSNTSLPNDEIGGQIGQAHYDQWKDNFGTSNGAGTGVASLSSAVPEPSVWVMIVVGTALATLDRRRRALH
jgi:hypothetical protein